jgi:hypothetical protein
MSNADKLFYGLGYKLYCSDYKTIEYISDDCVIGFSVKGKYVELINKGCESFVLTVQELQELQAINEKVKELGWLGDTNE